MTSTISLPDALSAAPLLGVQQPRVSHVPESVSSAGQEAIELAALAELHLDPWEQLVLVGALGERADGKWAAFEVGINAPRQNGKGSILEARELAGAILFDEKLLIHSAHEQATSSEHFLRLLALFETAGFSNRMKRPVRGKGSEAILFTNGARILFKTRTGGGGRGLSGDFVGLDEAMILSEAASAALVPTMAARSITGNPQLWYSGSAVDQEKHEHGVVFARVRKRGIRRAPRVAWFEWSAEGEHPDKLTDDVLADPRVWAQANPGMGIRISQEHIANEHAGALGRREFAVERLGVGDWPATDGSDKQVIGLDAWKALTDPASGIEGPLVFVFDVAPDRRNSAIGAAGRRADGLWHVEVIDQRRGTGWVVDRVAELDKKHRPAAIACDEKGPAASLLPELDKLDVKVETINATEHAQGCGLIFDTVDQKGLRHLGTPELEAAIKGACKRPLGDAWAWSRKSSAVDISPLVACTLALWKASTSVALEPMVAWR